MFSKMKITNITDNNSSFLIGLLINLENKNISSLLQIKNKEMNFLDVNLIENQDIIVKILQYLIEYCNFIFTSNTNYLNMSLDTEINFEKNRKYEDITNIENKTYTSLSLEFIHQILCLFIHSRCDFTDLLDEIFIKSLLIYSIRSGKELGINSLKCLSIMSVKMLDKLIDYGYLFQLRSIFERYSFSDEQRKAALSCFLPSFNEKYFFVFSNYIEEAKDIFSMINRSYNYFGFSFQVIIMNINLEFMKYSRELLIYALREDVLSSVFKGLVSKNIDLMTICRDILLLIIRYNIAEDIDISIFVERIAEIVEFYKVMKQDYYTKSIPLILLNFLESNFICFNNDFYKMVIEYYLRIQNNIDIKTKVDFVNMCYSIILIGDYDLCTFIFNNKELVDLLIFYCVDVNEAVTEKFLDAFIKVMSNEDCRKSIEPNVLLECLDCILESANDRILTKATTLKELFMSVL